MFKTYAAAVSSLIAIATLGKMYSDTKTKLIAKTEEAETFSRMYKRIDEEFKADRASSTKLIVEMYWEGIADAEIRGRKLADRPKR